MKYPIHKHGIFTMSYTAILAFSLVLSFSSNAILAAENELESWHDKDGSEEWQQRKTTIASMPAQFRDAYKKIAGDISYRSLLSEAIINKALELRYVCSPSELKYAVPERLTTAIIANKQIPGQTLYVINGAGLKCSNNESICDDRGCVIRVFVERNGEMKEIFNDYAFSGSFYKDANVLTILVTGKICQKNFGDRCLLKFDLASGQLVNMTNEIKAKSLDSDPSIVGEDNTAWQSHRVDYVQLARPWVYFKGGMSNKFTYLKSQNPDGAICSWWSPSERVFETPTYTMHMQSDRKLYVGINVKDITFEVDREKSDGSNAITAIDSNANNIRITRTKPVDGGSPNLRLYTSKNPLFEYHVELLSPRGYSEIDELIGECSD